MNLRDRTPHQGAELFCLPAQNSASQVAAPAGSSLNIQPSVLVVVDSAVEDYGALLAGVSAEARVAVLNRDRDGVAQITALLRSRPEVDELHIVSHGSPGTLYLGNGTLSLSTLDQYTPQLGSWFSGFRDTSSIAAALWLQRCGGRRRGRICR